MKNKILLAVGSLLIAGLIFFFGAKSFKAKEAEKIAAVAQAPAQDIMTSNVFARSHSMKLGPENAKVQLVEFLDPECESCREFYPMVKTLLKDYEGKIQLVVRYAAFHPNSMFAIQILEASKKQNKYWETLDLLFRHQPEWGGHHDPRPEKIWDFLPEIGLNVEQVRKDMQDPAINEVVEQDRKDGVQLNVQATPSFFVNGKPLEDFGYEGLKSMIDQAAQ